LRYGKGLGVTCWLPEHGMASNNTTKLGRRNDGVRDNIVVLLAKSEPGIVSARRGLPAPISGEKRGRRNYLFQADNYSVPFFCSDADTFDSWLTGHGGKARGKAVRCSVAGQRAVGERSANVSAPSEKMNLTHFCSFLF